MIIHDFNQPMPNALKHELRDSVMVDENIYPHKDLPNPIYSTFFKSNEPHFPLNVERFYFDWIGKILDDLGLMGRVGVISSKWCQVYNNDMGGNHDTHTHYTGNAMFSWVHFVDVPKDQKCFYFLKNKQKYYPPTQRMGDFIVFPSWASHGADPVKVSGVNRTIVSGNILCMEYKNTPDDPMSFVCSSNNDNGKQQLIWEMRHDNEKTIHQQQG
jgi:hypothetical protein